MAFEVRAAKKIVLTGGSGFLGRHVHQALLSRGARPEAIVIPRSKTDDLRDPMNCLRVTAGADLVIHLAATVGGIGFNKARPGTLFFDNAVMGINVIDACRENKIRKLVVAGTICAYPRHTPVPFKEMDLWNGYPEETNAPYGIAKKSLLVMLEAYRQEYGLNGVFVLPVNLYGPHDNFDPEHSHVIPALIRKFIAAKDAREHIVTLWGDGTPTREFLFVEDAARGLVQAAERYESSAPVNLGSSEEISICELATVISKKVGYEGEIRWDTSKPNGQERRKLDVSLACSEFGFEATVGFSDGLDRTISWWRSQQL